MCMCGVYICAHVKDGCVCVYVQACVCGMCDVCACACGVCVCICAWPCVCVHVCGVCVHTHSEPRMELSLQLWWRRFISLRAPANGGHIFASVATCRLPRCFNRPVSCETGWSSSQSIHSGCPCGLIWRPSCFIWIWKGRRQSIILAVYPTAFPYRDFPSFLSSRRILSLPKSPVTNIPVQSQWQ